MVEKDVCRLCLDTENLVWIFDKRIQSPENMKDVIFVTTSVEIAEKDSISQKICSKCCEITLKMFKFRTQAIKNDKDLKAKYAELSNNVKFEVTLPPEIKIKRDKLQRQEELPKVKAAAARSKPITKKTPLIHRSVTELTKKYPKIILPTACLSYNLAPVVATSKAIADKYISEHGNEFPLLNSNNINQNKCEAVRENTNAAERTKQKVNLAKKKTATYFNNPKAASTVTIPMNSSIEKETFDILEPPHKIQKLVSTKVTTNESSSLSIENAVGLVPASIDNSSTADNQSLTHVDKSYELFMCKICNGVHYSRKDLKMHYRRHLRCHFCKRYQKSLTARNAHLEQCTVRKAMFTLPVVSLSKLEYNTEIRMKFPEVVNSIRRLSQTTGTETSRFITPMASGNERLTPTVITKGKIYNAADIVDNSQSRSTAPEKSNSDKSFSREANHATSSGNELLTSSVVSKETNDIPIEIVDISDDDDFDVSSQQSDPTDSEITLTNILKSTKNVTTANSDPSPNILDNMPDLLCMDKITDLCEDELSTNSISNQSTEKPAVGKKINDKSVSNKTCQSSTAKQVKTTTSVFMTVKTPLEKSSKLGNIKPVITVRNRHKFNSLEGSDIKIMKELLKNLKPKVHESNIQTALPTNSDIFTYVPSKSCDFRNLRHQLENYKITIRVSRGSTFQVRYNYHIPAKRTKRKNHWYNLKPIDITGGSQPDKVVPATRKNKVIVINNLMTRPGAMNATQKNISLLKGSYQSLCNSSQVTSTTFSTSSRKLVPASSPNSSSGISALDSTSLLNTTQAPLNAPTSNASTSQVDSNNSVLTNSILNGLLAVPATNYNPTPLNMNQFSFSISSANLLSTNNISTSGTSQTSFANSVVNNVTYSISNPLTTNQQLVTSTPTIATDSPQLALPVTTVANNQLVEAINSNFQQNVVQNIVVMPVISTAPQVAYSNTTVTELNKQIVQTDNGVVGIERQGVIRVKNLTELT